MRSVKSCPKCGSINVDPLVFYRPSVWRCSDCGYEGAFIIEGSMFAGRMQERNEGRCGIFDWIGREPRLEYWDCSTSELPRFQKTA